MNEGDLKLLLSLLTENGVSLSPPLAKPQPEVRICRAYPVNATPQCNMA